MLPMLNVTNVKIQVEVCERMAGASLDLMLALVETSEGLLPSFCDRILEARAKL